MALTSTKSLGHGGIGLHGDTPKKLFDELQGLTTATVTGAGAGVDITLTGIAAVDTIQSVVSFSGGVPTVIAKNTVTVKANAINIVGATTGAVLLVTYFRKAGAV